MQGHGEASVTLDSMRVHRRCSADGCVILQKRGPEREGACLRSYGDITGKLRPSCRLCISHSAFTWAEDQRGRMLALRGGQRASSRPPRPKPVISTPLRGDLHILSMAVSGIQQHAQYCLMGMLPQYAGI